VQLKGPRRRESRQLVVDRFGGKRWAAHTFLGDTTNSGKIMNALAMAASYDPDPMQFLGIRMPVTIDTCELIEERWANWSRQDPVTAIESQADNLRGLKALYIDCGEKDQFNLLYGARRLVRRLNQLGIGHRYEEFPDNHTGVDYRMDESLPFLAQAQTQVQFDPRPRFSQSQPAGLTTRSLKPCIGSASGTAAASAVASSRGALRSRDCRPSPRQLHRRSVFPAPLFPGSRPCGPLEEPGRLRHS
jgi:hypothetical protein